ncbi:MAG: efflux RND transporter periplasmic adaptor subunit [Flavobacteriia bacterium]|nr:efflux RND transporter periplasmic adaptor subunit [Flavobacteriia bacterium]
MKINYIIPFLTLLVACGGKEVETSVASTAIVASMKVSLNNAQIKNAGLTYSKLEEKEISSVLKLSGHIDVPPQNLISISIPLGGYLKSTKLLPGSMVKKGQTIAVLEDQQYVLIQQNYLLAKVKFQIAESEYTRQNELNGIKATSDKVFQLAQAEYKNAKINLRALNESLQLIGINANRLNEDNISKSVTISSPIDGYVSKVNANIGKYLTPSEVLFELVNVADIHLNLSVFEKDLPKLAIGQKLIAYDNNLGTKYPCEIILIGHSLSAEKNTEVHCHFNKYDKSLVPGMYMNAEVALNSEKALVLPEKAIIRFGSFEYVFVTLKNYTFEMVEVETGAKEKGYVEILNYEKLKGQTIVVQGAYSLLMKLKNTEEE